MHENNDGNIHESRDENARENVPSGGGGALNNTSSISMMKY